jgi:hypothetical protein
MTLSVWQRTIVNTNGDVIGGASVEVRRESDDVLITLFSTPSVSGPTLSNPVSADSAGFVRFYAAEGAYRITATSGAFSAVWRNVQLGTAQRVNADQNLTTADNVEFAGLNIDNVFIDGNSIGSATGEDLLITPQGDLVINADINATGTLDMSGRINVDNLRLDGSTISSTNPDDIVIAPQSGTVKVSGAVVPSTNNSVDLGSGSLAWRNLNLSGVASIDEINADDIQTQDLTSVNKITQAGQTVLDEADRSTSTSDTTAGRVARADHAAMLGAANTFTTSQTVTGTVTGTKFIPTGGTATGNGVYLPATNALAISTDGAERLRVSSAGNTLLGTTTDNGTDRLQVSGTVSTGNLTASGAIGRVTISATDANQLQSIQLQAPAGATWQITSRPTDSALYFCPDLGPTTGPNVEAAARVRFYSSGRARFGTGADNGTDRLQVDGSLTATTLKYNGTDTNTLYGRLAAANTWTALNTFSGRASFTYSGDAGVSTCSVIRSENDTDARVYFSFARGASPFSSLIQLSGQGDGANGIDQLRFASSAANIMALTQAGRTLLGTTTDNGTDRLQVSGSAIATSARIGGGASLGTNFQNVGSAMLGSDPSGTLALAGAFGTGTAITTYNSSTVTTDNLDQIYLRKNGGDGSTQSIAFGNAGGSTTYFVGARIKAVRTGTNGNSHLDFETKSDSSVATTANRLRITNTGNILIGTTTDNATDRLQVNGSLNATTLKEGTISLAGKYLQLAAPGVMTVNHTLNRTENDTASRAHLTVSRGTGAGNKMYFGTTGGAANDVVTLSVQDSGFIPLFNFHNTGQAVFGNVANNAVDRVQVSGSIRATTGIRFADAGNLLANYTEGTWTPTMTGSGGSAGTFAVTTTLGNFTRIGNRVSITGTIADITDLGSWSGDVRISLPLTVAAAATSHAVGNVHIHLHNFSGSPSVETVSNLTYLRIPLSTGGSAEARVQWSNLVTTANNFIRFSLTYQV